ncbi:uncharacterized protein LOC6609167 isoform X2 [Drosophila sechellia]|uniref:uncharacterized protein LOC6609167 isoform X2 n=1 Tax=Drosophila sechellia TaxID=7238 RepID=UPI0013DE3AF4|nr:uncharacterized protein LOC6609167 isoform X2 [Drosophila sechellia]
MTTSAVEAPNSAYPDLEKRLERYLRSVFCLKEIDTKNEYDPTEVEYFGLLSLCDVRAPRRKLWYMYYATTDQVDKTVDQIHRAGMRSRAKNHFKGLKWQVKGNILEAPPNSSFNDEKVVNTIADLYQDERRRYFDYLKSRSNLYKSCTYRHINA